MFWIHCILFLKLHTITMQLEYFEFKPTTWNQLKFNYGSIMVTCQYWNSPNWGENILNCNFVFNLRWCYQIVNSKKSFSLWSHELNEVNIHLKILINLKVEFKIYLHSKIFVNFFVISKCHLKKKCKTLTAHSLLSLHEIHFGIINSVLSRIS